MMNRTPPRAYFLLLAIAVVIGAINFVEGQNVRIRRASASKTLQQRDGAFENAQRKLRISVDDASEDIKTNARNNSNDESQQTTHIDSDSDAIVSSLLETTTAPNDGTGTTTTSSGTTATNNLFTRIVGGDLSDPGEFPYYVDLGACAGSLIAPTVVLSAAHCNLEKRIGRTVTVGATKRKSTDNGPLFQNAEKILVVDAIVHPKFRNKNSNYFLNNDFGLLLLEKPYVLENDNIQLLLNNQTNAPQIGESLAVMGMGATDYGSSVAQELRDAVVPAISNNDCESLLQYGISKKQLCAGEVYGKKDACQGDSGGPLVLRRGKQHIQVGITSWGRNCGIFPGVYSRISEVYGWIQEKVCVTWKAEAPSLCRPNTEKKCVDKTKFARGVKDCKWVAKTPDKRCNQTVRGRTKKYKFFCNKTCGTC